MGVGILIVTHGNIGQSILDIAIKIIGSTTMPIQAVDIDMNADGEQALRRINQAAINLDNGDGVLILTDMFGATPSNIASASRMDNCILVSGLNLPMLIRLMNYHSLPLDELSDKAVEGGKDAVLAYYLDKDKINNHAAN